MLTAATEAPPKKTGFKVITAEKIIGGVLEELQGVATNTATARGVLLTHVKQTLAASREMAEKDLLATRRGKKCAKNLSHAQDEIIRAIYMFATEHVYPRDNPTDAETLCLAAVGGYGRATLAPGSDIDLLFILPYKQTPWGEQVTEFMLYMLWDIGQKVGHAVRSVDDCLRMAKSDMTVRTATLEARFLTGEKPLFDTMTDRFAKEIMGKTGADFIAAKMQERDERHKQIGNTRYVVEPNVKDGKGGLRDLNTLFWIGKYVYQVRDSAELVGKGVLSQEEYRLFERSEDFLWAVRCNLHFLTGRADEKLSFDVQSDIARRLRFADDRRGMLGVERFMKRYFLVAKDVGDLTRIFCTSLEFAHLGPSQVLKKAIESWSHSRRKKIRGEDDYAIEHGRITIAREDLFEEDPVNILKIFWLAGREDLLFHPEALKALHRSLNLIGKDLRNNKRANAYFMEILTNPVSVERILRRMNESGVLGKFVPEFGKIVALMQFNMYHHYTVDEHLIRSVGVMAQIAQNGLQEELPLTHELLPQLSDTRLLFVALFLHDIAKGRDEDHSIAGARVARRLCPRFGLSPSETDTVAWLIEYHLLMSEVAQSRDLQDPQTSRQFAEVVQSPNRLALLMILTACDIMSVGPGVWTGWKGSLLRSLYYSTEPLLSGGHAQIPQSQRIAEARETLASRLGWSQTEMDTYSDRHFDPYWLRAELALLITHAKMIRTADGANKPFAGSVRVQAFEGITEVSFYTPDHSRLLSTIAGACTMCDASILGAQVFSMRDGHALDTFRLRRAFTTDEDERVRAHRIIDTVRDLLHGEKYIPQDLGKGSRQNRRLKPFSVPGEVHITNVLSNKFTVIEVSGLDRTGLLHHLTRALSDLNLSIGSAQISTFGEKAVDVFYVTDLTGAQIESRQRQNRIREALMQVLDPNALRASQKQVSQKS